VLGAASPAGVVLDDRLEAGFLEALTPLLLRSGLPILAIEAPCPASRASAAMLCAGDRAEATAALEAALATIAWAPTVGARFVVLRLGQVAALERDFAHARDRYVRGDLDPAHALELLDMRDQLAERSLDAARRALDRLCRAAEAAAVTLVLRSPRRYSALPSPREVDLLLADLRGAPLAPALDVPAAHLLDDMGFYPMALSVAAFGAHSALIYGGDACGPIGALPPGMGVVDPPALPAGVPVAISPWSGLTLDETQLFDAPRR
jgi:hypothetical protein